MKEINKKMYFKMKELSDKTKISKSTIQYYHSKELLPGVEDSFKNINYYPEITISVLNLITYLRNNLNYTIDDISFLFDIYEIDFSDEVKVLKTALEMITYEAGCVEDKHNVEKDKILDKCIMLGILNDKDFYFKKELEIIDIVESLISYDVNENLLKDYIDISKKLASIEKNIADSIFESTGALDVNFVMNVVTKFKPFVLNKATADTFNGGQTNV